MANAICVRPSRGCIHRCTPTMVDICCNIFIEEKIMTSQKLPPVHPREILLEEYLRPLGISQNKLGRDLNVPPQRINEIVRGQRAITVDTALRLARYFHTTPHRSFGSTCKPIMIWNWQRKRAWWSGLSGKCGNGRQFKG